MSGCFLNVSLIEDFHVTKYISGIVQRILIRVTYDGPSKCRLCILLRCYYDRFGREVKNNVCVFKRM